MCGVIYVHISLFFPLLSLFPLLNRDTQICMISLEEPRMDFQGPGTGIRITEDLNEQVEKPFSSVMGGHSLLPTSSYKKSN